MTDDPEAYAADDDSEEKVEVVILARDFQGVEHRSLAMVMTRAAADKLGHLYGSGLWTDPGYVLTMRTSAMTWGRPSTPTTRTIYLAGHHLLSVDVLIYAEQR